MLRYDAIYLGLEDQGMLKGGIGMIQWWFMIFFSISRKRLMNCTVSEGKREIWKPDETCLVPMLRVGILTVRGGFHRFTGLHRWWKSWRMRMMTSTSPTQPKWIWSSSRSLSVISDYSGLMLFLYSRWESAVPHCCLQSAQFRVEELLLNTVHSKWQSL